MNETQQVKYLFEIKYELTETKLYLRVMIFDYNSMLNYHLFIQLN